MFEISSRLWNRRFEIPLECSERPIAAVGRGISMPQSQPALPPFAARATFRIARIHTLRTKRPLRFKCKKLGNYSLGDYAAAFMAVEFCSNKQALPVKTQHFFIQDVHICDHLIFNWNTLWYR